jgi:hypothetical protein
LVKFHGIPLNHIKYHEIPIIHWLNPVFYPTDSNITSRPNGRGTCHRVKEAPPTGPHGPRHHTVRRGVATEPGRSGGHGRNGGFPWWKIGISLWKMMETWWKSWESWWFAGDVEKQRFFGRFDLCWFMIEKHIWSNIGIAICLISMFYSKAIFEQGCSNTFRE